MHSPNLFLQLLWSIPVSSLAINGRAPQVSTHQIHERRSTSPSYWSLVDRVEPAQLLPVRIGLTQQNLHRGDELIRQISHPSSPLFGKHLSAKEVDEIFEPSQSSIDAVIEWLMQSGVNIDDISITPSRSWLAFDASADKVERLLDTEYHWYEHSKSGRRSVGCEQYSVPEQLRRHIDYIKPGINLGTAFKDAPVKKRRSSIQRRFSKLQSSTPRPSPNDTTTCDQAVTPACIRALYNIPVNTLHHPTNALGVFEQGDFYAQEDLDAFFWSYSPRVPNGTHPQLLSINGGNAPKQPKYADGESDLDFELAFPLVYPQGVKLYQTDDDVYTVNGAGGIFGTFLDAIDGSFCNYTAFGQTGDDPNQDDIYPNPAPGGFKRPRQCGTRKLTNVLSISYSKVEADLPLAYQQRQCNEWMKLALQGHTILLASGDYGVSSRSYDPEPNGCLGANNTIFNPEYPSCPYVTIVGGTKIAPGKTVRDREVAAYDASHDGTSSAYSSGGGFSNIYSIPDFQRTAVSNYFSAHDPGYKYYSALHNATHNDTTEIGAGGGIYNRIGRGMPDISAIGQNIVTFIDITYKDGGYGLSEGTSASTPIVASMINNVNEVRLKAGKTPLGFLNYILYSNPGIFNDIVSGSNPGCGTKGFTAVKGWDPVTGLGTMDYPKLLNLAMSLP